MSVSHKINTDNNCSQFQIPQSAVEEIKRWRCQKMNNGEHDSVLVSPQQLNPTNGEGWGRLSETEEKTPQKSFSTKFSPQPQHPRIFRTYFVRLAEESPKRNYDEHSDSSTYDSFNCRETDVCRDSSDTESNSSYSSGEIGATIKVVEYEVASASNSEDLFTNDSSSGTDDFLLAAVARAICKSSKCSSDFADTEEDSTDTDTTYDSEFSLADYWVCVKCKNKQNNPMFRYCEKCYQIRKTHFPPRPRLRKSRTAIKHHRKSPTGFSSLKRSVTTSEIDENLAKKRKEDDNKQADPMTPSSSSNSIESVSTMKIPGRLAISSHQSQSATESISSGDENANNADQFYKVAKTIAKDISMLKETPYSKHSPSVAMIRKLNEQQPAQHLQLAAKRKLSKAQSKYKTLAKRKCYEKNAIPSSSSSDTEIETDFLLSEPICGSSQGTQKDSGFSSAPSSQERKSSSEPHNDDDEDVVSDSNNNNGDSSDTVCDELNESDVLEMTQDNSEMVGSILEFDINSQEQSLDKTASDMLLETTTESHAISTLVQSVSECSDAYTNVQTCSSDPELLKISTVKDKLRSQQSVLGQPIENNGDNPSYGSCMTCLTEPKNGVFVHSRFLHLCCCYKCAVKIWNKNKKCPICNCAVKNVMKLFVH